ncbi:MAG: TIGR03086 family metal-binding protein [Dermatophilaceae bacterium]
MSHHPTIALLPDAARIVTSMVGAVRPEQWAEPSPCAGWTVRDVLNHLVCEHLWAPDLLRGQTLEEVGDRYVGDLLGEDPVGSWRRAVSASMIAWAQADPAASVHTTVGPMAVDEYAHQMLLDLTVHGWDIGRSAGLLYLPIPPAVDDALTYEAPRIREHATAGIFASPVAYDGPDPFGRLLALLGRDPHWRA